MKNIFLAVALAQLLNAHTLVLVRWDHVDAANTLATSATFGFNGDGAPAFIARLYLGGNTNAPATNCWSWTAATFTPERRAALTSLANSPAWTNHVLVFDYDLSTQPAFPFEKLSELGLALPTQTFPTQP